MMMHMGSCLGGGEIEGGAGRIFEGQARIYERPIHCPGMTASETSLDTMKQVSGMQIQGRKGAAVALAPIEG